MDITDFNISYAYFSAFQCSLHDGLRYGYWNLGQQNIPFLTVITVPRTSIPRKWNWHVGRTTWLNNTAKTDACEWCNVAKIFEKLLAWLQHLVAFVTAFGSLWGKKLLLQANDRKYMLRNGATYSCQHQTVACTCIFVYERNVLCTQILKHSKVVFLHNTKMYTWKIGLNHWNQGYTNELLKRLQWMEIQEF